MQSGLAIHGKNLWKLYGNYTKWHNSGKTICTFAYWSLSVRIDLSSTKLSQTTFTHCHFISICIVIFILETISASFSRYNIIRIKCPIDWHALLELFVSHSVGRRRDSKKAEAKRKKCNWKFVENWDLKCFAYSFSALSHQTWCHVCGVNSRLSNLLIQKRE